jgi:isoquinoline 1-oxidoreductase beta subunit
MLEAKTFTGVEAPATDEPVSPSRRGFLKTSAAISGALMLSAYVPFSNKAYALSANDPPMPNVFIRIAPDNMVTVIVKHLDKGQGIATGLTTIVADELDADWGQMRSEFAPANAALYNNLGFGTIQGTGGSSGIANSWKQLREAGAAARAMLVEAAAQSWNVPASSIHVEKGVVSSGVHKATFGELAQKASALPVPKDVRLKDPKDWIYIGKYVPRLDNEMKTTGEPIFALDHRVPGMLTAVLQRPLHFGGTVKSFDAADAKAIKGVVDVVQVPQGIVVLATDTWSALKGRKALKIEWDHSKAENRSSDQIFAEYSKLAGTPGTPATQKGDAAKGLEGAVKIVDVEYRFPFLAHAPMEPLNATMEIKPDGSAEIWAGSQFQTVEQMTAAAILGLKPEQVKINTLWAGGSFGRRATPSADYIAELATIVKIAKRKEPIHLIWTREDDLAGGYYRPATVHRIRAGVDAQGNIAGWESRIVNQSFMYGTPFEPVMVKNGVDATAVEGAADMPYAIPNLTVEWHRAQSPITTLWWRSVGHSHTAQAVETMIDALAVAGGKDPLALRLDLLKDEPRYIGVLKLAADKAGYGEKMPAGKGRGIAVHESFKTYVAMVADVSVSKEGVVKVDRIVAAVDCGLPINPDIIKAQVEGGAGFALGAALRNQITFKDGKVEQSNFDTYEPLRLADMPKVEVYIVPSTEDPTGIGEPGVPPVAPAISNAIFAATGKRLSSLPWDFAELRGV